MFLISPGKRCIGIVERPDSRPAFRPSILPALPLLIGLSGALLSAGPALAQYGTPNEEAKIIIHVVPVTSMSGRACSSNKAQAPCDQMVTNGKVNEYYYGFVCVVDGKRDAGIAGVTFGVKFNRTPRSGVDISEWTRCGTLEFPTTSGGRRDWYNVSNGGNLVTWDPQNACQTTEPSGSGTGVTAVAGYFYLTAYSADRLEIVPRPADNQAAVADCTSILSIVAGPGAPIHTKPYVGTVEFSADGSVVGSNPCGLAHPVVGKTWTGVKQSGR
ncbi:MAG TPA: hypothetical protein VF720_14595 [Candidatus Eisenbacteria bacterium]